MNSTRLLKNLNTWCDFWVDQRLANSVDLFKLRTCSSDRCRHHVWASEPIGQQQKCLSLSTVQHRFPQTLDFQRNSYWIFLKLTIIITIFSRIFPWNDDELNKHKFRGSHCTQLHKVLHSTVEATTSLSCSC